MGKHMNFAVTMALVLAVVAMVAIPVNGENNNINNSKSQSLSSSSSSNSTYEVLRYVKLVVAAKDISYADAIADRYAGDSVHKVVKTVVIKDKAYIFVRFKTEEEAEAFVKKVTGKTPVSDSGSDLTGLVEEAERVGIDQVHIAKDISASSEEDSKSSLDIIIGVLVAVIAFVVIGGVTIQQINSERHH